MRKINMRKESLIVDVKDTELLYKYVRENNKHDLVAEGGIWTEHTKGTVLVSVEEDEVEANLLIVTADGKHVTLDYAEAWYTMVLLQKIFPDSQIKTYNLEKNDEQEDSQIL